MFTKFSTQKLGNLGIFKNEEVCSYVSTSGTLTIYDLPLIANINNVVQYALDLLDDPEWELDIYNYSETISTETAVSFSFDRTQNEYHITLFDQYGQNCPLAADTEEDFREILQCLLSVS